MDMVQGEAGDFYSLVRNSLAEDLNITGDTPDDVIARIAEEEECEARYQGQVVTGIYEYLIALRDGLK